mgnify:CR=1 FL=1
MERSRPLRETGIDSGLGSTRLHPDGYGEFQSLRAFRRASMRSCECPAEHTYIYIYYFHNDIAFKVGVYVYSDFGLGM